MQSWIIVTLIVLAAMAATWTLCELVVRARR